MSSKKGVSALASMIALGAIIVLVTGTSLWVENSRTTNYISDTSSAQVMAAAESALQDALLKLNLRSSNVNYNISYPLVPNGISVSVCYFIDTPTTGIYTIRTKASKAGLVKAIDALVNKDSTTSKFKIYSKTEETDVTAQDGVLPCSV